MRSLRQAVRRIDWLSPSLWVSLGCGLAGLGALVFGAQIVGGARILFGYDSIFSRLIVRVMGLALAAGSTAANVGRIYGSTELEEAGCTAVWPVLAVFSALNIFATFYAAGLIMSGLSAAVLTHARALRQRQRGQALLRENRVIGPPDNKV